MKFKLPLTTTVFALLAAAPIGLQSLPSEHVASAAVKVTLATVAIGVAPGALVVLLCPPKPVLTVFELLGMGIAVSFGIAQFLTCLALTAHLGTPSVVIGLMLASIVAALWLMRSDAPVVTIQPTREQIMVGGILIALGFFLYLRGSPIESFEDQVHASIVRRLAHLDAPAIDNFYFAPGVIYTYPFPGVHYLMALVSRAGDIDALFVYQKLRFFWGPSAILMLYLAARAVFGTTMTAATVAVTAAALAVSGVFADVPRTFWAQLVPYSHPSDVALGVVLPALLASTFGWLQSESRRERAVMLSLSILLVLVLSLSHVREVIQYLTYLGAFLIALVSFRSHRVQAHRTATLIVLTLAVVVAYVVWHQTTISEVADLVRSQRDKLAAIAVNSSLAELLFAPPHELLSGFFFAVEPLSQELTPFLLFAGPLVIFAFRHRPLIWFLSSGMLVYLLLLSVPALAIPYIYLTYYEVFFMPVRYFVFFLYLMAGAFVHLCVIAAAGIARIWPMPLIVGGLLGLLSLLAPLWLDSSPTVLVLPLAGAYALTFSFLKVDGRRHGAIGAAGTTVLASIALVAMIPFGRTYPEAPPPRVNVRWIENLSDEARLALERRFRLTDGQQLPNPEIEVWNYGLLDVSRRNIEQLVRHPDVADTHHIDRAEFRLVPDPPVIDDPVLGLQVFPALQYSGVATLGVAAFLLWSLAFAIPHGLAWRTRNDPPAWAQPQWRVSVLRYGTGLALFLVAFAPWTARPARSAPVAALRQPAAGHHTPAGVADGIRCVTRERMPAPFTDEVLESPLILDEVVACPIDPSVATWIRTHVPTTAVFAINRWNERLPTVLIPQQIVAFPGFERAFAYERLLFRDYYRLHDRSIMRHRTQPFFNDVESVDERREFVETLGVTHILVDPAYYDTLTPVLNTFPALFVLAYTEGQWAVYEVRSNAG